MRVDKKVITQDINVALNRMSAIYGDNERTIDFIFNKFARLHGIGVAVKEDEVSNTYAFMSYPNRIEDIWHPLDTGYEESTCISVTMTVIKRQIEKAGADNVKHILKTVEKKLNLPHWEDYLEEKPKHDNGASYGFRANNWICDDLGPEKEKKHDDQVDALYYGYNAKELQDLGKSVVDKSLVQLKDLASKAATVHFAASRGCGKSNWIMQAMKEYAKQDAKVTCEAYKRALNWQYGLASSRMPDIDKVVFNEPATIVFWKDGTKTVVKAQDGEVYDPEKGLAMAICKKVMGNTRDYYIPFKKYLKQWKKERPEKEIVHVDERFDLFSKIDAFAIKHDLTAIFDCVEQMFTFSDETGNCMAVESGRYGTDVELAEILNAVRFFFDIQEN